MVLSVKRRASTTGTVPEYACDRHDGACRGSGLRFAIVAERYRMRKAATPLQFPAKLQAQYPGSLGACSPLLPPLSVCMKATRSARSCSLRATGTNNGERLGRSNGSFS